MWTCAVFRSADVSRMTVVVGLHRLREHRDTQSFSIRAACPHSGYNSQTMENDLLLLQVGTVGARKRHQWGIHTAPQHGAG